MSVNRHGYLKNKLEKQNIEMVRPKGNDRLSKKQEKIRIMIGLAV